jgi:DNA-binding MarR family transcriptional regulator
MEQLKLENQLCFPMYAAGRKIVNSYTPFLKPLNLTYTQYLVFMVLWEKKTISVKDLGSLLYLDSGTLTPLLKKMEKAGYLNRHRSTEDERVLIVEITQTGMEMAEKCQQIPSQVAKTIHLSPVEAEELYTLLYRYLKTE